MTPAAIDELLRKIRALTVEYVDLDMQITDEQFDERLRSIVEQWAAGQQLMAALFAIADELESSFDQQLYGEMSRLDHDPHPDDEFSVNITAKQLKALAEAVADSGAA